VSKKCSKDIVKACVILHNVVRIKDSQIFDYDVYENRTLQDLPRALCTRPSRTANDLRDRFAEYFVSTEGSLPWQLK